MQETRSASRRILAVATMGAVLVAALLLWRFGTRWLRGILLYLSAAPWARRMTGSLPPAKHVASRFVAGENIDAAIAVTRELNGRGLLVTLDFLGESVSNIYEAVDARDEILRVLDAIHDNRLDANVSVKLSQLGLKLDPQLALDNMKLILERARQTGNRVRIDMEESGVVDTTFGIYRTLRYDYGFENVGVVVQAYLYRTAADVEKLIAEGAWVRLCKGAYAEPPDVAFPVKAETDASFVRLMQAMLSDAARANGVYLGVATHDEAMIQATIDYATSNSIPTGAFEFQMLYGIRRELQEALVAQGYRMRVYVPYGQAWHPYFVRRLAERPANLWFFVSNLART